MSDITAAQKRALREVKKRAKGWPIGIPLPKAMARRLVAMGLAEWASPIYVYPKPVFAVRLTVAGELEAR